MNSPSYNKNSQRLAAINAIPKWYYHWETQVLYDRQIGQEVRISVPVATSFALRVDGLYEQVAKRTIRSSSSAAAAAVLCCVVCYSGGCC